MAGGASTAKEERSNGGQGIIIPWCRYSRQEAVAENCQQPTNLR
jgi:hypothetical protein